MVFVGLFATYFGFVLLFPRQDLVTKIAVVAMFLPPTIGLVSLGVKEIAEIRPVLFSSPALPLALVFARACRAPDVVNEPRRRADASG